MDNQSVKDAFLAAIPSLRAFSISMCGRSARAEDLVQETLVKAWAHLDSFEPGTNMNAWLYRILRNEFYSAFRKGRHEVADEEGRQAARLATRPTQEGHLQFREFREAMDKLAPDHREALLLVGAAGHSYDEAAALCGCAVGTMKSRVNRARSRLAQLLDPQERQPLEANLHWDAAVAASWSATSDQLADA
jgi:RNA polymerase sigma-70 factor (ECF subfamily)